MFTILYFLFLFRYPNSLLKLLIEKLQSENWFISFLINSKLFSNYRAIAMCILSLSLSQICSNLLISFSSNSSKPSRLKDPLICTFHHFQIKLHLLRSDRTAHSISSTSTQYLAIFPLKLFRISFLLLLPLFSCLTIPIPREFSTYVIYKYHEVEKHIGII